MKKLIANDYNVLDVLKENPNGGYFGKHKDGNKPKIRLIYTDNSYLTKEKCALLLIRMSKHYFNQLTDWFDDVIKRNFFSVAHLLRKETPHFPLHWARRDRLKRFSRLIFIDFESPTSARFLKSFL